MAHAVSALPGDEGFDAGEDGTGRGTPLVAFNCQQDPISGELARSPQGGCDTAVLPPAARPRRLTPRECERLQGMPDDWTRWGDEGELKDGPRYRMIGDAVTVNVAEWIGRRLYATLRP